MIVWSKEGGLRSIALSCYGYPESLAENIEDIESIAMILSATTVSISFHSVGPRLRAHCAIRGMSPQVLWKVDIRIKLKQTIGILH